MDWMTFAAKLSKSLPKFWVSLALISYEIVIISFDQVCSAARSFPAIRFHLEYFEEAWLRSLCGLAKRSTPYFSINLWNRFDKRGMKRYQKTNNVEGGRKSPRLGMGFSNPTKSQLILTKSSASLKTKSPDNRRENFVSWMSSKVSSAAWATISDPLENKNWLLVSEGLYFSFCFWKCSWGVCHVCNWSSNKTPFSQV